MKTFRILFSFIAILTVIVSSQAADMELTLAVNNASLGSIDPAPGTLTYAAGDTVTVKATPNSGYRVRWQHTVGGGAAGALDGSMEQTVVVTMSPAVGNQSLRANFELITWALTLETSPTAGGTAAITSPSAAIADPAKILKGTVVSMRATPASGWRFAGWESVPSGKITETGINSLETKAYMDTDIRVIARFERDSMLLRVLVTPPNIGGTVSGAGNYSQGEIAGLKAIPSAGYVFKEWKASEGIISFNPTNDENSLATLGAPHPTEKRWSATAHFEAIPTGSHKLLLHSSTQSSSLGGADTGGGTITATVGSNSVTVPPDSAQELVYQQYTRVDLVATASTNFEFVKWESDDSPFPLLLGANVAENAVSINGETHVKAVFQPIKRNVTVKVKDRVSGSATVGASSLTASNGSVSVTATSGSSPANTAFAYGGSLNIVASPGPEWVFKEWESTGLSGVIMPSGPSGTITLGASPASITAVFAHIADTRLTLRAATGGKAAATGTFIDPTDDQSITVAFEVPSGNSGTGLYLQGTAVALTATVTDECYEFENWMWTGGNTISSGNPTTISLNEAKDVTANFKKIKNRLTVDISPAEAKAAGAVVKGTVWPYTVYSDATTTHNVGASVALKAENSTAAGDTWVFSHWTGDFSGSANPSSITMDTDKTVTAVYTRKYTLTLDFAGQPAGGAHFTVSTGTLTKTGDKWIGVFDHGTSVTIEAKLHGGLGFSHWSGSTDGLTAAEISGNPLTITMNGSKDLTANLAAGITMQISVKRKYGSKTEMKLANSDADQIRLIGNVTYIHDGESYARGYLRAFGNRPASSNLGQLPAGQTVRLSTPAQVPDLDSGIIWVFSHWVEMWGNDGELLNQWSAAVLSTELTLEVPVANKGYAAVYSDQRTLAPTVLVDGAKSTAAKVTADATILTSDDSKDYTYDTTANLNVPAGQVAYVFQSWENVDTTSGAAATALMRTDRKNVVARFKSAIPVTLDVIVQGGSASPAVFASSLKVAGQPVSGIPHVETVGKGDSLNFEFTPATTVAGKYYVVIDGINYRFKGWDTANHNDGSVDSAGTSLTRSSINAAQTVSAVFVRCYTLTTQVNDSARGSISPATPTLVDAGMTTSVSATPALNNAVKDWTSPTGATMTPSDTSGQGSIQVLMNADHTVIVNFESAQNALTIRIKLNGSYVTDKDMLYVVADGTTLCANQTKTYYYGVVANLTASTTDAFASGYVFTGWESAYATITPDAMVPSKASIHMDGAQVVTAVYKSRHTLTLSSITLPSGTGGTPAAHDYVETSGSAYVYYYGSTVRLVASPETGYRFLRWEIDTDGNSATTEITGLTATYTGTISSNWDVRAVYAKEYTITFATNPAGGVGGTVNKSATYSAYHGEKITDVIASPKTSLDWYFTNWTVAPNAMDLAEPTPQPVNGSTDNPMGFVVADDHVVTANFSRSGQERTLTINVRLDGVDNPAGCQLTVLADGSSVAGHTTATRVPGGGSKLYYKGDLPQLDATPADASGTSLAADYEFVGWGDSASPNPIRTLPAVIGDGSVTAIYRTKAVLYMQVNPAGIATTTPVPPDGTPYATFLGENVNITATPVAAHIDDYAFEKWTSLPASPAPSPVDHYNSVINMNAKTRTAIAHFKPGCRLEVIARYETTARPGDTKAFANASNGSRTTVSSGNGNVAAIRSIYSGEPNSAVKTVIIDEVTGKATARIMADPASPGYRFVRWDVDDNNDGVIDRTISAASGDLVMDSTIGRSVTAYAIFEKTTVTLTVHTVPSGISDKVDGRANTASTGAPVDITSEPKVYRYFYGDTASLEAINNEPSKYVFDGWYRGEGYSDPEVARFSTSPNASYGPLKADAEVTAIFWPAGKFRIILFLEPKDKKIDITNIGAIGAFTITYMKIDKRDACVVGFTDGLESGGALPAPVEAWVRAVGAPHKIMVSQNTGKTGAVGTASLPREKPLPVDPSLELIIPLRAAQSVTGWNSETSTPEVRAFLWWEMASGFEAYDAYLFDRTKHDQAYFVCPVLDTMDPNQTPRIIAIYEPPGGAAIQLDAKLSDFAKSFVKPGSGSGWLWGTIHGTSMIKNEYLLYVGDEKFGDWTDKVPLGTQEHFSPDATFTSGPLKIVSWDYDPDTRDGIDNWQRDLPSPSGFTCLDPLASGQEQHVIANLDVNLHTVAILKPHFQRPAGWPEPVFTGSVDFMLNSMDYAHTGNRIDDYYASKAVSPVTVTEALKERQFVQGASAPGLTATASSANYTFVGWDTTGGTNPNLFINTFSWSDGTWPGASWASRITGDRKARPIYTINHPLTLTITPVDSSDKHHFNLDAAPYGIEVPVPATGENTQTKSYAQGSTFTLKASSTDNYHVVKSWIIYEDELGDGTFSKVTTVVSNNNTPGEKTHALTLNYPAKSEVVFGWQQMEIKLDVANSKDGQRHGDVKLDGVLLTPRDNLPLGKAVDYGTTHTISAIADTNYLFKGWTPTDSASGPANSTLADTTVTANASKTITAHFERKVTLVMATDPSGLPANVITPNVGTYTEMPAGTILADGDKVDIQALGRTGYDFTHWTIVDGATPDPSNPRVLAGMTHTGLELHGDANAKVTITAHYAKLYHLTINAAASASAGADGAEESKVAASPSPSVDGIAMVAVANGMASVTGQFREYAEGEVHAPSRTITLTPTPGQHYEFDRWELTQGGVPLVLTPAPGTNAVTLPSFSSDVIATAYFKKKDYTLTVAAWKAGTASLPPGSDGNIAAVLKSTTPVAQNFPRDGSSGTLVLPYKSNVTLVTSAASRFVFVKWTDAGHMTSLGEDQSGYAFSLTGNTTVHAEFKRDIYELTTAVTPAGYGSITASPVRNGDPTSTHEAGGTQQLTAVPAQTTPGITTHLFKGWMDVTKNGTSYMLGAPTNAMQNLAMDGDWRLTAEFVRAVRIKVDTDFVFGTPADGGENTAAGKVTVSGYIKQDADGWYVFAEGAEVAITAEATSSHFIFDEWTGLPAGATQTDTGNPTTKSTVKFTAASDEEITAHFEAKVYALTVLPVPAPGAAFLRADSGHDFLTTSSVSYYYPKAVTLETEAVGSAPGSAAPHYRFVNWTEGGSQLGTGLTLPFTFNRTTTITANYQRQIQIEIKPGVDITRSPEIAGQGGNTTPGSGTHYYDVSSTGNLLMITVSPATGYEFAEWRGLPAGVTPDADGKISLSLTEALANVGDLELTPCFQLKKCKVSVSTWERYAQSTYVGGTAVRVTPAEVPSNIYYYGTEVTVKATPDAGYRFVGWDFNGDRIEDTSDSSLVYTFTVSDPEHNLTALFQRTCILTLECTPTDAGLAEVLSPVVPVSPTGTYVFDLLATPLSVTIKAIPSDPATADFLTWVGLVQNASSATTTVVMDSDKKVIANFGFRVMRTLVINVDGNGQVTASYDGNTRTVSGPGVLTEEYPDGARVSLLATPDATYSFGSWTGTVTGTANSATNYVDMTSDKTLAASFAHIQHTVHAQANPISGGTVTGGGSYAHGSVATLTASANTDYLFKEWHVYVDGNSSYVTYGAETINITVNGDIMAEAMFELKDTPLDITVTVTFSPAVSGAEVRRFVDSDGFLNVVIRSNSGWNWSGWGGDTDKVMWDVSGLGSGERGFRTAMSCNLEAIHQRDVITITTSVNVPDKGIVTLSVPSPITRPASGRTVEVTLIPLAQDPSGNDSGWLFDEWEGGTVSGTAWPYTLVLDSGSPGSIHVRAKFKARPRVLALEFGYHPASFSGLSSTGNWVELTEPASMAGRVDFGSSSLTRNIEEYDTARISCVVDSHLTPPDESDHYIDQWVVTPSRAGVHDGSNTLRVSVYDHTSVKALVLRKRSLLETFAESNPPDEPGTKLYPTDSPKGGYIDEVGLIEPGITEIIVWAYPRKGWYLTKDSWTLEESNGWTRVPHRDPAPVEETLIGDDGEPYTVTKMGICVQVGSKTSSLTATFFSADTPPPPKIKVEKTRKYQLDNSRDKSSSHHIHTEDGS